MTVLSAFEVCDRAMTAVDAEAPLASDLMLRWIGHQKWIPKRHRLVRRLWRRRYRAVELDTDFYGLCYRAQLENWLDFNVYFFGAYARPELAFVWRAAHALREAGRQNLVTADIGANVGHHAIFMSRLFDEVWAFEPYEPVRRRAEAIIARNAIKNIRLFPFGLGDRDAWLSFDAPPNSNLALGRLTEDETGMHAEVKQAGAFLDASGVPRLDLVKIDVEGFEPAVLRGLKGRLERDRPIVLIETVHTPAIDDEAELRRKLYPDARVFELRRAGNTYRLGTYRPGRAIEAVIIPAELLERWPAATERPPRHLPGVSVSR